MKHIEQTIADELSVTLTQVKASIDLLDQGATVPFIARYRKEVTGSLDDTQLRTLEERLRYLRELEERRASILKSIDEQGKLTPTLAQLLRDAVTKNQLEDLYLPYKPKRRTKGQIAIEAGLEPLAETLLNDPNLNPQQQAGHFLNPEKNIHTEKDALDGAKFILMERFSEAAALLDKLRQFLHREAALCANVIAGKEAEGQKFTDYFEFSEPLQKIPSHRALALFRGRNEGILSLNLGLQQAADTASHPCEKMIAQHWEIHHRQRPADDWLAEVVRWCWRVKVLPHLETDLLSALRERAETDAIEVFSNNLKDLLLAAPAGQKATIGLDPGLRSGVKMAVLDSTGKVLDHGVIYPTAPQYRTAEAEATLIQLCRQHQVSLIAIGNGTASRETHKFTQDILRKHPDIKTQCIVVSEAGASVYSASEIAAREFPDLDVTLRGAISIARRLQDPLAELVKIEPKAIGVGQYQHDVSQVKLSRSLDAAVEDCVNTVGVEVNTASAALLAKVSGLNHSIANNIVAFRNQHGIFTRREQLKKVPRLGEKTYEQAIGFIRIANGDNPLDASAVHPESYHVVERISQASAQPLQQLIANTSVLRQLDPKSLVTDQVGLPTIIDILAELEKPGRDPRPAFKTASFKEGVDKISDLKPDMILEGTISNVTNFGAFVDIGVHQDGLVHISALSDTFVKDPRAIVKAGDIVKVKVMAIDIARKRIGLSMRLDDRASDYTTSTDQQTSTAQKHSHRHTHKKAGRSAANTHKPATTNLGSMGNLLQAALDKHKRAKD
ncbi:MAG: RNA-binding transcriptional accessory protein [Cellvibrionaceae bacterium]|nr:RNA-binding transcriptional accessory protein [Cellvibrionaceae bacterium]